MRAHRGREHPVRGQPYAAVRSLNSDRLNQTMLVTNLGVNLLESGHKSKWSVDWATRPSYTGTAADGAWIQGARKHEIVLQYQVYLN